MDTSINKLVLISALVASFSLIMTNIGNAADQLSPTPTASGSGAAESTTLVLDDGTKAIARPECSDGDLCGVVQLKTEQHREDFIYDRVEIYNHFSQAVGPVCGQYNLEFRYLWHGKTQATHDELEPVIRRMTSPWSTTCAFLGRPFTVDNGKIYTTVTQNRNGSLSLSFTAR